MKAAVLRGAREIRTEEVPYPALEPHGIILKVKACGICGSDLHIYKRPDRAGTIFGHEFSGEVVEVGKDVKGIEPGMRVTAVGFRPCGNCFWCQQGKSYRCSHMELIGYEFPGAMAEYVHVPFAVLGRTVFPLPDELSYKEGASVEPLSISYFSVNRAQPKPEDTVLVIGLGVIGLHAIQVLKALGVRRVIASGRRASRLEAARVLGADHVIDAAREDTEKAVMELTGHIGVDIVIECAGQQVTFDQSMALVKGGGKVMLVGVYEKPLTWDPLSAIAKNVSLIGCLGGNFPACINLLQSGQVKVRPLITHTFSLDQAAEAFTTQLTDPGAIKVMFVM
ncbi:MAG TPA: alcohol dehydrogenase catalytic domain-containing protein [Syntrophales bacterium]|mgnify:CR=1 FL=1|nr:alcohol dehydrogenase catalytic domain-containing protein [Syntrophales bacterium]HOL58921.1 alcohol dehydrogenase catalytic domain-containing protein [Syntrophales bacterium]HPO35248.1 alcohol dehydrogenase catalytic domain-containing protein [Syntrophales bacterium]